MKKVSHKPPSRVNYEAAHPTVSIRVTCELYNQLEELRHKAGKSLGDILREAVGKQAPSTKRAYDYGFLAAKSQFAVTYKCSVT